MVVRRIKKQKRRGVFYIANVYLYNEGVLGRSMNLCAPSTTPHSSLLTPNSSLLTSNPWSLVTSP